MANGRFALSLTNPLRKRVTHTLANPCFTSSFYLRLAHGTPWSPQQILGSDVTVGVARVFGDRLKGQRARLGHWISRVEVSIGLGSKSPEVSKCAYLVGQMVFMVLRTRARKRGPIATPQHS